MDEVYASLAYDCAPLLCIPVCVSRALFVFDMLQLCCRRLFYVLSFVCRLSVCYRCIVAKQ